ncbi:MAG: Gfo/Idh/MocA family oxidoreductase [Candidatus Poribacteria bacterium]|jgi:predicted dehydrogenase|nr:Gfo/Idh/MocA family oxidoreductase [Candidatus Poribacteria bacterium]MEE2620114.1 Gfo/Idh/MocA family oxidoreductase [Candidatus Poribacteria bacterium]|tara:strand:+ start:114 stop:1304 length:1191 start_codon:yes stop_codon:yes gene_type:complete
MPKLNIALIGAGRRGAGSHLPVISKLKDTYNLVAICDIDEKAAVQYAKKYGVNAYTNVRDLIEKEQLDVVDITVPKVAHHAVTCFVADAGINILCETPIAASLPMSDLMIEAANKNNVKLEIAENYYRAPKERFLSEVIGSGVIGEVGRIYRIFYEGGHHGMSMLRLRANGNPRSILGISQTTPIVPIIDRMKRHHTNDKWSLGFLEFDNNSTAIMIYSNTIHARSLGRGQNGISQIDGSQGTIVGEEIHIVHQENLETGATSVGYLPQRVMVDIDGVQVIDKIKLELPNQHVQWDNPLKNCPLSEGQVAVADELLSIANAVIQDTDPEYGAIRARQDQEMNIAMNESAQRNRETVSFPITTLTETETKIHEDYEREYGHPIEDVEAGIDTFFPRR